MRCLSVVLCSIVSKFIFIGLITASVHVMAEDAAEQTYLLSPVVSFCPTASAEVSPAEIERSCTLRKPAWLNRYTDMTYWKRQVIRTSELFTGELWLKAGPARNESIQLYLVADDGAVIYEHSGFATKPSQRAVLSHYPLFKLRLEAGREYILYMGATTRTAMSLDYKLLSSDQLIEESIGDQLLMGLVIAFQMVVAIACFSAYFALRYRILLWYGLTALSLMVYEAAFSGWLTLFMPEWIAANVMLYCITVAGGLAILFIYQSIRELFNTPKRYPRLDFVLKASSGFSVVYLVALLLGLPYSLGGMLLSMQSLYLTVLMSTIALVTLIRGDRYAVLFAVTALAFLTMGVGRFVLGLGGLDLFFVDKWFPLITAILAVMVFIFMSNTLSLLGQQHKKALDELEQRVSERTQALEKANLEVERASQAKSALLAGVSHELRSPLHSILGYAQLLNQRAVFDPQGIEQILRSGRHLLRLINEMIDFARNDNVEPVVLVEPFSLNTLTDNLSRYGHSVVADKQLSFSVELLNSSELIIESDEQRINQIITNLIDNAVRHTQSGGIQLSLDWQMVDDNHIALTLKVSDTGAGIGEAQQARIFEPFTQLKKNATSNRGLGLGLAIAQQYAQQLGGKLMLSSTVGVGSTFSLSFPAMPFIRQRSATASGVHRFSGKVLVVDDEKSSREVLKSLLSDAGLDVFLASSVAEAKTLLAQQYFDLMVTDQYLDDGTCWDLLIPFEKLSAPVVIVSATTLRCPPGVNEDYLEVGQIHYLAKPVWKRSLEAVLLAYLPKDNSIVEAVTPVSLSAVQLTQLSRLVDEERLVEIADLAEQWRKVPAQQFLAERLLEQCEAMDMAAVRALLDELRNKAIS